MNLARFTFKILMIVLVPVSNSMATADKGYLRIESTVYSEESSLNVTSIGALIFENNLTGNANISYLDSALNGSAATLDLGGGFVLRGRISLLLLLGVSVGYNWDTDDLVTAYYPEIGLVTEITSKIGISLSGKRYISLYEKQEDVIMLGFVFSY
jgi:hypothetical protein